MIQSGHTALSQKWKYLPSAVSCRTLRDTMAMLSEFVPMGSMSKAVVENRHRPSVAKSVGLFFAALLAIWFCFLLGPLSLLLPVIGVVALVYFLRYRRLTFAMLLVLATPLTMSFSWGIVDYANGNASLRFTGLPGTTSHNLDPELRCGRGTSGCIVMGNEWCTQSPYNGAVRLLTATCGWMPNTYVGPYPSESDAKDAIVYGVPVSHYDLHNDRLMIDGAHIGLDDGVGAAILDHLRHCSAGSLHETAREITATIWKRECVILHVPMRLERDDPSAMIALISRSAGRPFAYYGEGDYYHHFPPVTWKRRPTE